KRSEQLKALKIAAGISGGVAILFLLFKGSFDFVGANDGYYRQAYGEYGQSFVDALKADRKSMFTYDSIRTLLLVLFSASGIWLFLNKKVTQNMLIIGLAVLILFDLVSVDRRYVNNENFVSALQVSKPFQANQADLEIMKDDSHFRVFDVVSSGARASY